MNQYYYYLDVKIVKIMFFNFNKIISYTIKLIKVVMKCSVGIFSYILILLFRPIVRW